MSCQAQDKTENVECRAEGENVSKQITLTSGSECASATVAIVAAPKHGTATLNGGELTYQPDANYIGQDYVGYQVSAGNEYSCGIVTLNVGNGQCHVEVERCDGQPLEQRTWVDAKVFENADVCKIDDMCCKQKGGCPSCPTSDGTVGSGTPVSGGCEAEECQHQGCGYIYQAIWNKAVCKWDGPNLDRVECNPAQCDGEWHLAGSCTIEKCILANTCVDGDCPEPEQTTLDEVPPTNLLPPSCFSIVCVTRWETYFDCRTRAFSTPVMLSNQCEACPLEINNQWNEDPDYVDNFTTRYVANMASSNCAEPCQPIQHPPLPQALMCCSLINLGCPEAGETRCIAPGSTATLTMDGENDDSPTCPRTLSATLTLIPNTTVFETESDITTTGEPSCWNGGVEKAQVYPSTDEWGNCGWSIRLEHTDGTYGIYTIINYYSDPGYYSYANNGGAHLYAIYGGHAYFTITIPDSNCPKSPENVCGKVI